MVAGVIFAALGAVVCGCIAAFLTRRAAAGRRRAIIVAASFPFACLVWAGAVFVFQAVVNERFLERDLGIGDEWFAPLPNGYQVRMINSTGHGWVYGAKRHGVRPEVRAGVRLLQVTPTQLFGALDSKAFDHLGSDSDEVDRYFVLEVASGSLTDFRDRDAFTERVRRFGTEPMLEPIYSIYSRFRFGWFDVFAGLLLLLPLAAGGIVVVVWIGRLQR